MPFISSILGHCKYADECVRLSLVKSFCVPPYTYCIGAVDVSDQQVKDLAVCWNDSFRRIFGYKRHESVKVLQFYCGELYFDLMYELIKWRFLTSCLYVSYLRSRQSIQNSRFINVFAGHRQFAYVATACITPPATFRKEIIVQHTLSVTSLAPKRLLLRSRTIAEIGRASCRERV